MADSQGQLKKLTPMQDKFVQAYCGEARFNASEAARLAGYSEKSRGTIGHDLKNTPNIRARIDEILDANTLTNTEILRELTDIGMRDLHEFIEVTKYDKDGNPVAAKMDASAKMKALELLGKARALFTDKQVIEGEVPVLRIIGMTDEELG